jgi:hypothetical protein
LNPQDIDNHIRLGFVVLLVCAVAVIIISIWMYSFKPSPPRRTAEPIATVKPITTVEPAAVVTPMGVPPQQKGAFPTLSRARSSALMMSEAGAFPPLPYGLIAGKTYFILVPNPGGS